MCKVPFSYYIYGDIGNVEIMHENTKKQESNMTKAHEEELKR